MRAFVSIAAAGMMLLGAAAIPVRVQAQTDTDILIEALEMDETVRIMREEGLRYGKQIAADMLPGVSEAGWAEVVSGIYDTDKMAQLVSGRFAEALEGVDTGPMVAFFTSERGREIIALELSAREALLETQTEAAAMEAWEIAQEDRTRLAEQVEELIADSDLIDFNVMGALNSNLMFYRGLADGGAVEMSEADMLADVWSQEEEVRDESLNWLGSFLLMAYQPLDPDDLDAYAAFYRTDEGRALNSAIFSAYDRMYEEISYLLGHAVALHMRSEDL